MGRFRACASSWGSAFRVGSSSSSRPFPRPEAPRLRWTTPATVACDPAVLRRGGWPAEVIDAVRDAVADFRRGVIEAVLGPQPGWFPGRTVLQAPGHRPRDARGTGARATAPWAADRGQAFSGHITSPVPVEESRDRPSSPAPRSPADSRSPRSRSLRRHSCPVAPSTTCSRGFRSARPACDVEELPHAPNRVGDPNTSPSSDRVSSASIWWAGTGWENRKPCARSHRPSERLELRVLLDPSAS